MLHGLFADYRHRGEWFKIEGEVLEFIEALKSPHPQETGAVVAGRGDAYKEWMKYNELKDVSSNSVEVV